MSPSSEESQSKRRWRKRLCYFVGAGVLVGMPFALRAYLFSEALDSSLVTLRLVSEALPHTPDARDPSGFEPLFSLWPGESDLPTGSIDAEMVSAVEESRSNEERGKARSRSHLRTRDSGEGGMLVGPVPHSSKASVDQVLQWVEARLVPSGVTRPEGRGVPAGIELKGVGALGIGLIDGDRLVRVNGISVSQRGQVVAVVLAARAKKASMMQAALVRMTAAGPVEFYVTVEQPYVWDRAAPESTQAEEVLPEEHSPEVLLGGEEHDPG